MKKAFKKVSVCILVLALFLSGCADKSEQMDISGVEQERKSLGDSSNGGRIVKDKVSEPDKDSDLNLNGREVSRVVDLSSEDVILEFLEGEWTMINRDTRDEFGRIKIGSHGTFDFVRTKDKASGYGTIGFTYFAAKEDEAPDQFRLEFDDMSELIPAEALIPGEDKAAGETSGIFHIGIGEDKDYLYLKEIGNGDTMISLYALNVNKNVNDRENWNPEWLFVRERSKSEAIDTESDETFYAWAWERDSDGVWLQPMTLHEYESEEDYTGRRYMAGYFSQKDEIEAGYYRIADRMDLSGLLEVDRWSREYPLMMYEVTIDKKGKLSGLKEIDQSYYNIYDLGNLEPEFGFEGSTFTINGQKMDIRDFAPGATAIMDCKRVGDWIIVDCHVNPHFGLYEFYNLNSGDFEYEIEGTNLTWHGNDLSTAVYSRYNQVFDFWGNLIGWVDEGEVYGLKWNDEETVGAECWMVDGEGEEKEFTQEIEYRPRDKAVLSYFEYMLGGTRQWRNFMDEMPDGAAALVMINPPQRLLNKMPGPQVYDKDAFDRLVIVSLMDGENLHIEADGADASGNEKYWGRFHEADRGDATVLQIVVPEGAPNGTLVISTPHSGEILWDIAPISGESAVMSKFLTVN